MCGVAGMMGRQLTEENLPQNYMVLDIKAPDPIQVLTGALLLMEYRGYDSSGLAVYEDSDKPTIIRASGKIKMLMKALEEKCPNVKKPYGVAHTRWATHGRPTEENAHPHKDCTDKTVVVHNGVFENFFELRVALERRGHTFKSETDTEVLAHLIEEEFANGTLMLEEAVSKALKHIIGTLAVIVMSANDPDKLVFARRGMPLIIGIADDKFIAASDLVPILAHTRKIINVGENELGVLTPTAYKFMSLLNGTPITKVVEETDLTVEMAQKGGYANFMLKEIYDIPDVLEKVVRGRVDFETGEIKLPELDKIKRLLKKTRRIVIAAAGTSRYAGIAGKLLIKRFAKVPVDVIYASEFASEACDLSPRDLVVVVSQSGETKNTRDAMAKAQAAGAKVLAIVNVVGSNIAINADATLYLHAGPEIAVASTKAFVSQMAAFMLFALYLEQVRKPSPMAKRVSSALQYLPKKVKDYFFIGKPREEDNSRALEVVQALRALPEMAVRILSGSDHIKSTAEKYAYKRNFLFLGSGLQMPVALEGALKLKEISYIPAEGYPPDEMRHGPNALIDGDSLSVVLALQSNREQYDLVLSNVQVIKARGGYTLAIATEGDEEIAKHVDDVIYIPKPAQAAEECDSLLSVITLELFAYYVAIALGLDPDQPRNLAKSVTV